MSKKIVVGFFFGGRSTEHEVSVVTALQAYENLDKDKYEVIPIYVSKSGQFYSNPKFLDIKNYQDLDALLLSSTKELIGRKDNQSGFVSQGLISKFKPINLAFPLFHGSFGEDGAIQGLFEIYQIPYVGFNVTGSALGMDKVLQKALYKSLGFNVGHYFAISRNEWLEDSQRCLKEIQANLKYPLFVKPATIGSSIGINKVTDEDSLSFAIEVATTYSDKILVEEAFEGLIEVNCSALGYGTDIKASVCEMPVASSEILSFADKYQRGGSTKGGKNSSRSAGMASLSRVIPAPISQKLTKEIQEATVQVFQVLDGCGVARVDFFVDKEKEKFWINEINTLPGSLAFYLWEKSGLEYQELLDKLIDLALKRFENQQKTQYTFDSGLLSQMALSKGTKS
ncbi:D-alanine--D-alanine ligase [Candidatus Daviesbacteria bacterium]|nr:D-alanine--D-alanine ligase [Candidatus Daviesbacteria bacterium]